MEFLQIHLMGSGDWILRGGPTIKLIITCDPYFLLIKTIPKYFIGSILAKDFWTHCSIKKFK